MTARPPPHPLTCALVLAGILALSALAGCSGGSPAAAPSAIRAGSVPCPTAAQITAFVTTAFGDQAANPRFGDSACAGGWAAGTVTLKGGLEGRIALRNANGSWTPVLVGGASGPCPATVQAAPEPVLQVLGC